jgi:hypothetical protein
LNSGSSSGGRKYSAVPESAHPQPGWSVDTGATALLPARRESGDGEALLVGIKQPGGRRRPGKPFRIGSNASAKDGECRMT